MKKTPWFPCSIKPVYNGWYEVALDGIKGRPSKCQYSGGRWRRWSGEAWNTANGTFCPGAEPEDMWRGIAK